MTDAELITKKLTCTMCGYVMETYAERCNSRGFTVCGECKKLTKPADDRAFDRYIENR